MKHRTVSVVILWTKNGKLLLQDRKGIAKFGEEYDFFGGGIEEGETPEEAALRELKEELDYNCSDLKFFKKYEYNIDNSNSRTMYVFTAKAPKTNHIKVLEGRGAVSLKIKDAVEKKLFPNDNIIIKEFDSEKGFQY